MEKCHIEEDLVGGGQGCEAAADHALVSRQRLEPGLGQRADDINGRYLDRARSHGPRAATEIKRLLREVEDSAGRSLEVSRVQVEVGPGIERGKEDCPGLGSQRQGLGDPARAAAIVGFSASASRSAVERSMGYSPGAGGIKGGEGTTAWRSLLLVSAASPCRSSPAGVVGIGGP